MVTIDPNNTKFDMGELRLDKDPIISDEFEVELTTENEAKNSTSSRDPYRYSGGNNEYGWSASGVALEFEDQLIEAQLNRTSFPIGVYNFDDDGDYDERFVLKHARINSITHSVSNDGTVK